MLASKTAATKRPKELDKPGRAIQFKSLMTEVSSTGSVHEVSSHLSDGPIDKDRAERGEIPSEDTIDEFQQVFGGRRARDGAKEERSKPAAQSPTKPYRSGYEVLDPKEFDRKKDSPRHGDKRKPRGGKEGKRRRSGQEGGEQRRRRKSSARTIQEKPEPVEVILLQDPRRPSPKIEVNRTVDDGRRHSGQSAISGTSGQSAAESRKSDAAEQRRRQKMKKKLKKRKESRRWRCALWISLAVLFVFILAIAVAVTAGIIYSHHPVHEEESSAPCCKWTVVGNIPCKIFGSCKSYCETYCEATGNETDVE